MDEGNVNMENSVPVCVLPVEEAPGGAWRASAEQVGAECVEVMLACKATAAQTGDVENDAQSSATKKSSVRTPVVPNSQSERSPAARVAASRLFGGNLRIDVAAVEKEVGERSMSPRGSLPAVHSAERKPLLPERKEPLPVPVLPGVAGASPPLGAPPFLEYGMVVSLVCDGRAGLIAAEGFASRDIRLEKVICDMEMPRSGLGQGGHEEQNKFVEGGFRPMSCPFRDCLFEVVPKMTYDATIALESLEASLEESARRSPRRRSNQHKLANLRFKSDAETRLNAMMYKNLLGTQVIYGQTIQLRHTKSRKYVTLGPPPVSFRGSEHAPVYLDTGSPGSHFSVHPRFKLRSKGTPVQLKDQLILTGGSEVQPFNLHVSNRDAGDGASVGMIGSSVHSSQWRAVYYDSLDGEGNTVSSSAGSSSREVAGLRAGSCVRLSHLESSSWLHFSGQDTNGSFSERVTLQRTNQLDQGDEAKDAVSSDSLWEVERISGYEGGEIRWGEYVALRHLLSGKYLAVRQLSPTGAPRAVPAPRPPSRTFGVVIIQDRPQAFRLMPTAIMEEGAQVQNGDVMLIQHLTSTSFIHSIEAHSSSSADIRLSLNPHAKGADSGDTSSTLVAVPGARDEDAFKLVSVPASEVTDTLLLLSYKSKLAHFVTQFADTAVLSDAVPLHFHRTESVAVFRDIERAVGELISFLADGADNSIERLQNLQNLFRSHQFIDVLVSMIRAPFRCCGGPFSINEVCCYNDEYMRFSSDPGSDDDESELTRPPSSHKTDLAIQRWGSAGGLVSPRRPRRTQKGLSVQTDWDCGSLSSTQPEVHAAAMKILNRILPSINVLLLHIFWGNRANELHVVKVAMPTLMQLLGNGFQTSLPLSYLLRENRNLVESITAYASIIRNFFDLIVSRGKSIRYMQYLVALCTARGRGVPKTQEAICELLFNPANGYRDKVVVPIRPSDNGFDICLASDANGVETYHNIEAMFSIAARVDDMHTSSGKWMSLSNFYKDYYVENKHRALGQYCYGLFRLYVSLCQDRNYLSIQYVQAAFPRENILKSVMDPTLSRSLRAVMMDLMRVAYVDCDPQKSVSCPSYTRVWTDIEMPKIGQQLFPPSGLSTQDTDFFSAMKDFCLAYFKRLQGTLIFSEIPENELALSILRVCRSMVEFGMYTTGTEISELVNILLDLLDERTDLVYDASEARADELQPHGKRRKRDLGHISSLLSPALYSQASGGMSGLQKHVTIAQATSPQLWGPPKQLRHEGRGNVLECVSTQPSQCLQNSVLFDGAGAMSSIRVSEERGVTKQYEAAVAGSSGSQLRGAHLPASTQSSDSVHVAEDGVSATSAKKDSKTSGNHHRFVNRAASGRILNKHEVVAPRSASRIDDHYEMNEKNSVVMRIKDEICAILLFMDQLRVDYLISVLLATFKARHGGPPADTPPRRFEQEKHQTALEDVTQGIAALGEALLPHSHSDGASPLGKYLFGRKDLECNLSLAKLARRKVTTILMQLLMYEYPPLVSKALELLLQQYNQHDQLMKEMESVQLLVTKETIATYNQLKDDVDDLRRLAETTEVWMDLTSRSDFEKARSACQLLKSLTEVVEDTETDDISAEGSAADSIMRGDFSSKASLQAAHSSSDEPCFSIGKQPPNRKCKSVGGQYRLSEDLGRVSSCSGRHQLLSLASSNKRRCSTTQQPAVGEHVAREGDTMAVEARRLLRNLKAAQFVLNMMVDGAHFFEGHISDTLIDEAQQTVDCTPDSRVYRSRNALSGRQRNQIRAVFSQGLQFLCAFCSGDTENQALLAPHAVMIAQYVGELAVAQRLLVAIYADNVRLYKAIPADLVGLFVAHLGCEKPDPRYLLFLETLVICNERPVLENQLLVFFQFVKALDAYKVLQLFDDATKTVELVGALMQRYAPHENGDESSVDTRSGRDTSTPSRREAPRELLGYQSSLATIEHLGSVEAAKMLEYHVRLVHFFAACASGKNTRVQEVCQQMLPLSVVLNLLHHPSSTEGMQFALLRYLDQAFLTADEIEAPDVDMLVWIMSVLSHVCEIRVIQYLTDMYTEDQNRRATLSLHKNKSSVGKMVGIFVQCPSESVPLHLLVYSVVPTLLSFLQQFPSLFDTSEEARRWLLQTHRCIALLLTTSAPNQWELSDDVMVRIEELMYALDSALRVDTLKDEHPPVESLEQVLGRCLAYEERLDCSSMDPTEEILDLLRWAQAERMEHCKTDPSAVGNEDAHGRDTVLGTSSSAIVATYANSTGKTHPNAGSSSEEDSVSDDSLPTDNSAETTAGAIKTENLTSLEDISGSLRAVAPMLCNQSPVRDPQGSKELSKLRRRSIGTSGDHALAKSEVSTEVTADAPKFRGKTLRKMSLANYFKGGQLSRNLRNWTRSGKKTSHAPEASASPPQRRFSPVNPLFNLNLCDRRRDSNTSQDAFQSALQQTMQVGVTDHNGRQFHELDQFLSWLQSHPGVHSAVRSELNQMVHGIVDIEASLEEEYDPQIHLSNIYLSFDLVVSKLVKHVEALQDPSYLRTKLTLMNVFCRMIYAVEDSIERHQMQLKLNQLGVTRLVVQLISSSENDALFASCIDVGVALLDGMNAEVQESFNVYWTEASNKRFFERIDAHIGKACKIICSADRTDVAAETSPYEGDSSLEISLSARDLGSSDTDKRRQRNSIFDFHVEKPLSAAASEPTKAGVKQLGTCTTSIFRFLQLLCEGHYLNAQRALISQQNVAVSANLVESTTSFLLETYLALTDLDMGLITQLFETITECCQGPCVEAQETVANYKFISAVNALLTHSFEQRDAHAQLAARKLRASIIVTLLSLLEGRRDSVLHTQLIQELNFEALKMNLVEVYAYFLRKHGTYAGNARCSEDFYLRMGFNIYILLQQLADHHPQQASWIPLLKDEKAVGYHAHRRREAIGEKEFFGGTTSSEGTANYQDAYLLFQSNCIKVEVVWDHCRSPEPGDTGRHSASPPPFITRGQTTGTYSADASSGETTSSTNLQEDINSAGTPIPFYFPIHPICFCLTEQSKKKLLRQVSRGVDKLPDFYSRTDKLIDEMSHQSRLQQRHQVSWFARQSARLKRVSFVLAISINLVVLLFYRADGVDSKPYASCQVSFVHPMGAIMELPEACFWIDAGLSLAGTLEILACFGVLICYMLNSAPLLIKKGWKRRHQIEQARRSKRIASAAHRRPKDLEERESFQDTERLLRSLRELEEEYDYEFFPPLSRKRTFSSRQTSSLASSSMNPSDARSVSNDETLPGEDAWQKHLWIQLQTLGISLFFLVRSPRVLYCLGQIFVAVLGSFVNKLYFAFLLLDIVDRYKELNNVLRSVVRPAKVLGVTMLLYLVVVYVFAVVGFFFFREDFTPDDDLTEDQREGRAPYACQKLFQCFLLSLDQGLKSDGGLGGYLRQIPLGSSGHSYGRLAFDTLYNTLLVILLLNLVFGIIIDTFASLRTADEERTEDMQTRCFICSIDAYTFDRATKRGFHAHVQREHNMWHYLYLFVHIRKKRMTDYTGLELFLAMRMAKKDVSFFPVHRALSLEKRSGLERRPDAGVEDDNSVLAPTASWQPSMPTKTSVSFSTMSPRYNSGRTRVGSRRSSIGPMTAAVDPRVHFDAVGLATPAMVPTTDHSASSLLKLEQMEATIAAVMSAQSEIKEAQRRAEERHAELLAALSGLQQEHNHADTPLACSSSVVSAPQRDPQMPAIALNPLFPRRHSAT